MKQNPKFESRNSKQIQMTKIQMTKIRPLRGIYKRFLSNFFQKGSGTPNLLLHSEVVKAIGKKKFAKKTKFQKVLIKVGRRRHILNFEHSKFGFVSDFGFRASDLFKKGGKLWKRYVLQ